MNVVFDQVVFKVDDHNFPVFVEASVFEQNLAIRLRRLALVYLMTLMSRRMHFSTGHSKQAVSRRNAKLFGFLAINHDSDSGS